MNVEGTPVTDAEFVPRTKTLALHWDFSTVALDLARQTLQSMETSLSRTCPLVLLVLGTENFLTYLKSSTLVLAIAS